MFNGIAPSAAIHSPLHFRCMLGELLEW
jgi:hypothetical protein